MNFRWFAILAFLTARQIVFASTSLDEKSLGSGEWQQLGTWSHDMAHGDDKTKQSIHLIWPVELKCGKGATLVKDVNKIMRTMGV